MPKPSTTYRGSAHILGWKDAWRDMTAGLTAIHIWGLLGWQDIRQRYRRSILGPFWLTLSTGIKVATIGVLYAEIFKQDIKTYLPYLAIGLVIWDLLATTINESCTAFTVAERIIKQVRLPLTSHVVRLVWRNLLIFAHNGVVMLAVVLLFLDGSLSGALVALIGLVLVAANCLWISLLVAVFCTRFRDIPQIVMNLVQITFFLTPILWDVKTLGSRVYLADGNPAFHLIEIMRRPLLDGTVPLASFAFAAGMCLIGYPCVLLVLARFRARVPYWL